MKFTFLVGVDTKNDGLTREAGEREIVTILSDTLASKVTELPWVLDVSVGTFIETDKYDTHDD